jgi:NhaP-type Na+/H+ and K+/H+ antiporter
VDVIPLLDLRADNVAVEEVRLPEGAASVGATLSTIVLPENVSVMAVLAAEGGVRPTRAETVLSAGDMVLLLVQGELDEPAVRAAFGIKERAEDPADSEG